MIETPRDVETDARQKMYDRLRDAVSDGSLHSDHEQNEADFDRILVELASLREQVETERENLREAVLTLNRNLLDHKRGLASLREQLEERDNAICVYTSKHHLCSTRPCSCGAYSSLVAALTQPKEKEQ